MIQYKVIGVMSGTSLDGIDVAYCTFSKQDNNWDYNIIDAHTYKYPQNWKERLSNAHNLCKTDLNEFDREYGIFTGRTINKFLENKNYHVDIIASHGHTVLHEPDKGICLQIGNGVSIYKETGIKVVNNFRALDVSLGGQGAPLVPIGDELLFGEYLYCINLGGFANISENINEKRIAYDICPVNIVINLLANKLNLEFDENGALGRKGNIIPPLLNDLNNIDYYKQKAPKSLSREWLESSFLPIITKYENTTEDIIITIYEHIANQINFSTINNNTGDILLTGGGANNHFLIELLQKRIKHNIIIPEKELIEFKEALIFALLGVLRIRNEVNCLSSVTGASRDCSGGEIIEK